MMLSSNLFLSLLPLIQLAKADRLKHQQAFDPFHSCSGCFRSSWTHGLECRTNTVLLSTISRILSPPAAATPTYAPSQWCSNYLRQTDRATFRVSVTAISTSTSFELYQPLVTETDLTHPTLTALCPVPSAGMECGWDTNTISPVEQGLDISVLDDGIGSAEECHQACLLRPACKAYRWDGKIGNPCSVFNVGIGPEAANLIDPTPGGTQWYDRNCPVDLPAGCTLGQYPYSNATAAAHPVIASVAAVPPALPLITAAPVDMPGLVASVPSPPRVPPVAVQGLPPPAVIPRPPILPPPAVPEPPVLPPPVVPSPPQLAPPVVPSPPNLPAPPVLPGPPRLPTQPSLPEPPIGANQPIPPAPPSLPIPPSPPSPPTPPSPPIQPKSPGLPLARRQGKLSGPLPPPIPPRPTPLTPTPYPSVVPFPHPPIFPIPHFPTPIPHPPVISGPRPPFGKGPPPPVGKGPFDPVGKGPIPPVGKGPLPPASTGPLPPVGKGPLPPVGKGPVDPFGRGPLDPFGKGVLPPFGKGPGLPIFPHPLPPFIPHPSSSSTPHPSPTFFTHPSPPLIPHPSPPFTTHVSLPAVPHPSPPFIEHPPPPFIHHPPPNAPPRPTPQALLKRSIPFPPYFADLNYIWSSVWVTPACSCIISSALPPVASSTTRTITRHNATVVVTSTVVEPFTVTITPRGKTVFVSVV